MKDLESILGAPLVEKAVKPIRLTSLGEEFAIRAREILRAVEGLGDLARASHSPLLGRLRFGVIPTIAPYFMPQFIGDLSIHYPGLEPRPREAVTQKLLEDVTGGRLDTAVLALPVSDPLLHEEPLFDEEFVLVRHSDDADKPVPNSDKLREMRLLLLEEGHCFRDQALSFCNITSSLPRDLMEASSLSTLVQMVGAGIGVTLIPDMAVPIETVGPNVSVSRMKKPRPTRRIGMVWRKTSPLSDQLSHIAAMIRKSNSDLKEKAPVSAHS